ncbi:sodium/mannose cotransporter SLC5A10-like [Lineus longissimus]|uniref:sodium/mannose cotransporter SLC5A10-like n=1 Tax=Lineus longissimus TaxID=88925 RepID=UPI00315D125B
MRQIDILVLLFCWTVDQVIFSGGHGSHCECPVDWTYGDIFPTDSIPSEFRVMTGTRNHSTAALACRRLNGTLASIHSQEENDNIIYLMTCCKSSEAWIGISGEATGVVADMTWGDNSPLDYVPAAGTESGVKLDDPDESWCTLTAAAVQPRPLVPPSDWNCIMTGKLEVLDFVILGLHFVITVAVGLWASCRKGRGSARGYFLAGRDMPWWLVGTSLYMSNIGTGSFIGIAGASSAVGIAVICYEFAGLLNIILLGYLFIPVYISSGVYTMPEYLHKRFGGKRLQVYMGVLSLLLFVLAKLSSEIYCGAIIIQETLGWNIYLSALALLAATALYTVLGGLAAVIYTDFLQSVVVIVGATIVAVISMVKVGGYESMKDQYMRSVSANMTDNSTCGRPDPYAFNILRPADDGGYPWPGVLFGCNILSAWYFCTDQVLVQRILAAKDLTHAKAGSVLAALLKTLPMFLMVWPGLVSRILFPETLACASPEACIAACGNPSGCSNIAYPKLIIEILPIGLRGLMLAAMLAALMSSLTSIFNSSSTVFTIDLWKKIRKNASETEQIIVGRLFIIVFLGIAIAWLPMVGNAAGGQLFNYLQSLGSYLASPIIACYLSAVLWKRTTEPFLSQGAFWGLMVGLAFGLARLIASFALPDPPCGEPDDRPEIISKWHFLHYAIFLFGISLIATIVVSLLTEPIPEEKLEGMTWFTRRRGNIIQNVDPETEDGPPQKTHAAVHEFVEETAAGTSSEECLTVEARPTSKLRKAWNLVCGLQEEEDDISEEDKSKMEEKLRNLAVMENPKWKTFVDVSAVMALVFGVFLWGFFS